MLALLFVSLFFQSVSLQGREQEALMTHIESAVRMPKGAQPLDSYDRFYRLSREGEVIAGFVLPRRPSNPDEGCLIVDGQGERPCPPPTAAERERYQRALVRYHGPRTREWIDDKFLPSDGISDGGCSVVNVRYDIAADRITEVSCNGIG